MSVIGGELVREARRRAGMTQQALADKAATTQSAIARLESGRTSPSLEQVERLLRLCGFDLIVSLAAADDQDRRQAVDLLGLADAEARARRLTQSVKRVRQFRELTNAG